MIIFMRASDPVLGVVEFKTTRPTDISVRKSMRAWLLALRPSTSVTFFTAKLAPTTTDWVRTAKQLTPSTIISQQKLTNLPPMVVDVR